MISISIGQIFNNKSVPDSKCAKGKTLSRLKKLNFSGLRRFYKAQHGHGHGHDEGHGHGAHH
jgi:hypothetical protein